MNIESEARSFISQEQYERLLDFFKCNATLIKDDFQETFYFDGEQDLRIQRNNFYAKMWLKKGTMHDDHREEMEIQFDRNQFETLEQLFLTLGFTVAIKWFRKRFEFAWNDYTVCLDYTKGYGYIIELEKMCSENEKVRVFEDLTKKLASLQVAITPKEEFDKKFQYYKEHWRALTV